MIAWLVETLIASTALMAIVLLIRQPVRRLFGAHAAYALWALPALRMILPPLGWLLPEQVQPATASEMVRYEIVELTSQVSAAAPAVAVWPSLLALVWITGLLAFAGHQWLAYRRFCGSILADATPREELDRGILLISSPQARGPMAFGLRRRFIVFPADADQRFDAEERAMALAHELAHHRRGDLIANAVALAILTLHWCNPLAWFAYRAFRADQELACDADVIAAVRGSALGHAYGRALVKSASGREFVAACNLTTVDRLKGRLAMLSNKSPSARRRRVGLMLTAGIVLSGLALTTSGDGMAAQVGAKVSAALPVPPVAEILSPVAAAAPAAPVAPVPANAAAPVQEERRERRIELADKGDLRVPAPPPVPTPPMSMMTPPLPPPPPGAMGMGPVTRTETRTFYYNGKEVKEEDIPAELRARMKDKMPQMSQQTIMRVIGSPQQMMTSDDCDEKGTPSSSTTESKSADGKTQIFTLVKACKKVVYKGDSALSSLKQARAGLANDKGVAEAVRTELLANLDRSIAKLEAETKKN